MIAGVLGYKSSKNGAFITTVADLRKYGLIEKRGFIATPLAKKIAYSKQEEQKNKYILEAINNIDLFSNLTKAIGTDYEKANFQAQLLNNGFSDVEAIKKETSIKNISKKIVPYLTNGTTLSETQEEVSNNLEGAIVQENTQNNHILSSSIPSKDNLTYATLISDGVSLKIVKDNDVIDFVEHYLNRLKKKIAEEEKPQPTDKQTDKPNVAE